MKIELREIYKCDHCKKLYQRKNACEKHEKSCTKNSDNFRACFGCKYLTKKTETIDNGSQYYPERRVDLLWCNKLGHFLHPPKVEHKGNAIETGELNEPMPKECEHRKEQEWI